MTTEIEFVERAMNTLLHDRNLMLQDSKFKFFIPKYLYHIFLKEKTGLILGESGRNTYKGITVVYGYEDKIILAHEDYPLYKSAGSFLFVPILK